MDGKQGLSFPCGETTSLLWEFIEMNKCQPTENPTYEHVSCAILMKDIHPQEAGAHPVLTSCGFS